MNKQETLKILAVLKAAYPNFDRGLQNGGEDAIINLWAVQFAEDSYRDVSLAVHTLISTRTDTFPPVIGEVKEVLRSITHPEEIPSGDAWEMVMRCIRRGTVHAAEDWAKLPDDVRAAVSVDEIKRHAEDENFTESVEKSLFLKRWDVLRERKRVENSMPGSLLEQIAARRAALEQVKDEQPKIETKAEKTEEPTATVTGDGRELYQDFSVAAFLKQERAKRERMEVIS